MRTLPSPFTLEFLVRDYECDLQGIVNNAVYLNYLEHTRHEFFKVLGFDFAKMHNAGKDFVVVRTEIDYKSSLRSGDRFITTARLARESRLRVAFFHEIYKVDVSTPVIQAKVIVTCISSPGGRPMVSPEIETILKTLDKDAASA